MISPQILQISATLAVITTTNNRQECSFWNENQGDCPQAPGRLLLFGTRQNNLNSAPEYWSELNFGLKVKWTALKGPGGLLLSGRYFVPCFLLFWVSCFPIYCILNSHYWFTLWVFILEISALYNLFRNSFVSWSSFDSVSYFHTKTNVSQAPIFLWKTLFKPRTKFCT